MKNLSRPSTPTVILILATGFLTLMVPSLGAHAQNSSNSPAVTQSNPQQDLAEAQRKYYEAQAAKTNEERSIWYRVVNLAAFVAALVAVLSLVLNYSSTLRAQRDTQFYEALKRFGDQDSPTVRSSAAGLLAKLSDQKGVIFRSRRPNFDIVLDQLMAGLLLEDNSVCLVSIRNALKHLSNARPLLVLSKVRDANLELQRTMIEVLGKYLGPSPNLLGQKNSLTPGDWYLAAASTPYEALVLSTLAARFEEQFKRACKAAIQEFAALGDRKQEAYLIAAQKEVRKTSDSLALNVEICSELLRTNAFKHRKRWNFRSAETDSMTFERIFLAKSNLLYAEMAGIKLGNAQLQQSLLSYANLQGADLASSNLRGSSLTGTNLRGAHLNGADLRPFEVTAFDGSLRFSRDTEIDYADLEKAHLDYADLRGANARATKFKGASVNSARLSSMIISHHTGFENVSWWTANFRVKDFGGETDIQTLENLFERYGKSLPAKLDDAHESVRSFLDSKNANPSKPAELDSSTGVDPSKD